MDVDFRQSESSYVARLTPSGALDATYGDDGLASFPTARIKAIGVDPAGRLVVAGQQGEAVFLARLTGEQGGSPAGSGGAPAHPPQLVSMHVTCPRVRVGRHRGAERCTVKLSHLRGTWKSALVLVDRRGHRIAERQIKRLRMPATLVLYLPASSHPTRWTIVFRDGSRVAHSRSLLVR